MKSLWEFEEKILSANVQRPPVDVVLIAARDGLENYQQTEDNLTLGSLPLGARLILRCRKDWRDAVIASISIEMVTLSVSSPSGHTYRVRRPSNTLLSLDGSIPVLGQGCWRAGRVHYDARW